MPVRYEDLSPRVQRQIAERVGASRQRTSRRGRRDTANWISPPAPTSRWKCHACGEPFKHWAKAQRHASQPGHHRIEVLL